MRSSQRLLSTAAILIGTTCAAFAAEQAEQPCEQPPVLSVARLSQAARSAGLAVAQAEADVPAAARSNLPFVTADYHDPALVHLRRQYELEKVVAAGEDEWSRQLLLKEWVHDRIPGGTPNVRVRTAHEILEAAAKGEKFWCTFYAITYTECALALGWQARKIGVDRNHGPEGAGSTHHGVSEVWSNQFRKWVVIDPQSNLHFEKDGVPLSAWDIRAAWLKDQGKGVRHLVGIPPRAVHKNPAINWWKFPDEDETACYFWMYLSDHALGSESTSDVKLIFPQDEANNGLVWYQNNGERGQEHQGYRRKRFVPTERIEDVYWTVGLVEPRIAAAADGTLRLELDSHCPNRTGYEVARNDGPWEALSGESVEWKPRSGANVLKLRTVSAGDVRGAIATLRLEVE
ncbi:MAG: hypothetical protein WD066_01765 [Planctomycetaceae bacterium]